jgi:hypothetical protein
MQKLSHKLKILKGELKTWNKTVFGDINKEVRNAVANLDIIQNCINRDGYTDTLVKQEMLVKETLENALNMEELFWQEKSRAKWHCQGDRNTGFFHRVTKIKQAYKKINSIRVDNNILVDPELISNHIVNHFTSLFYDNNSTLDNGLVEETIPKLINESTNHLLTMLPSALEIKNAVFSMNKDGAPGPDGFGAFFFQTYWEIINSDVCEVVLEFFQHNWIMSNFNANTLCVNFNANTIAQFRPIDLANFKFKIISKVLADRLAQIMPSIISKEQRGFIKGREIKDCICLTSEAINLLHKKSYGGNLAIKIDIAKAFDTIDWSFFVKSAQCFWI